MRTIFLLAFILLSTVAWGREATLQWDANTETNLTKYTLAWGLTPGSYTASEDITVPPAGTIPQKVVTNLSSYTPYYFAVKAVGTDLSGNRIESGYSNEVSLVALTGALDHGQIGVAYDQALTAVGGLLPYSFITSGLPPGLQQVGQRIQGMPTVAGDYTPTATVTDAGNISETRVMPLTVAPALLPTLVSISVNPASAVLIQNTTIYLTAIGTYSDNSTQNITNQVAWSSSNESIASVFSGLVTGIQLGTTQINATLGAITGSATVTVAVLPMINSLQSNPATIAPYGSSVLSWTTTGATSVSLNQGIGTVALNGTRTVSPAGTTTYMLTASNMAGSVTSQVTVTVAVTGPLMINTFAVVPNTIAPGESAELSWNIANANWASINEGVGNVDPVQGALSVSPMTTTTYVLTANQGVESMTAQAALRVKPAATVNIARVATVTASSQNTWAQQLAVKAVDGVAGGYPRQPYNVEWATQGGRAGSWIKLDWGAVLYEVDRVVLRDRPNTDDRILSATLTFSDGFVLPIQALRNDGEPVSMTFPSRLTSAITLTVVSVSTATRNVGLSEFEVYGTEVPNIASVALVSASSENRVTGQLAIKAVDGITGGYPNQPLMEWATQQQTIGAWLNLHWDTESYWVNRVILADRPNLNDQITAASLIFDDGSVIQIPALPNEGTPLELNFPGRVVNNLRLVVNQVKSSTANIGLAEITVYGASID